MPSVRHVNKVLIDACIESICEKGCQVVRDSIQILEKGGSVEELNGLSSDQKRQVLSELKSIMTVYGDTWEID